MKFFLLLTALSFLPSISFAITGTNVKTPDETLIGMRR